MVRKGTCHAFDSAEMIELQQSWRGSSITRAAFEEVHHQAHGPLAKWERDAQTIRKAALAGRSKKGTLQDEVQTRLWWPVVEGLLD